MLSWFGKKSSGDEPPRKIKANPGETASGRVAGAGGRVETFNVVDLLESSLRSHGYLPRGRGTTVELKGTGFTFMPLVAGIRTMDSGTVQTTSTVQIHHPTLVPHGVFEYQHWTGSDASGSLLQGLNLWTRFDVPPLLEALSPEPKDCMRLEMEFPAEEDRPAFRRRAVLGPVAYMGPTREGTDPAPRTGEGEGEGAGEAEHDGFCPCCLLTRSMEAFLPLFRREEFFAIRLFAMRDQDGNAAADCRVNGEDWDVGADALRAYVATWPGTHFEFRKQYVILHTVRED